MAKKPTTTEKVETKTTTAPAPAPSQPWATGDQSPAPAQPADSDPHADPANIPSASEATVAESINPSPATSEDAKPEGEVTSEQKDQVTPSGENPSEAVSEKLGDGATGNGDDVDSDATDTDELSSDEASDNAPPGEVTSVEKDQVTPTGKSPEQIAEEAARVSASLIDEMGNRVQGVPPKEEVIAEAKDQVTPHGTDIALGLDSQKKVALTNSASPTANDAIKARMAALSPEDRETFEEGLAKMAEQMLDKMERNQKANAMAANMVRGQDVYGNRARRPNHDETLGGLSNGNVQLNRRARRQAERVLRERTGK